MKPRQRSGPDRGGEETRKLIVDVARELFAERGFARTTVKNIAERCSISDAALYYHFPSKRHILEALWEAPATSTLRSPEPGEVLTAELFRELIELQLDVSAEQDAFRRVLVREALAGDPVAMALRGRVSSMWRKYWWRYLRTRFEEEDASRYCDALLGILQGATLQGQLDHGAAYPELLRRRDYRDHILELALTAVPLQECRGGTAFCPDGHHG